ncbi:MAG: hypothetical protein A2W91_05825 [Bacteroidetes bacterium GWF2_38_335]|nr:MAG: hypothetical protein A2W91_05825 [Bacteroidetes bacterium GWF2_38_335]OFY81595.1 MAG: hypothetical protein A2281_11620 [Bacteroidetes bacterium RIFOXYA12_FULL_38_20]HBS88944.1 GSCFA domain protein [Bacteroidales bacterium]
MQFRTPVEIPKAVFNIDHRSNLLFMGSCFSVNMGRQLQELKINSSVNPFGVLYNPVSINNSLEILLKKKIFGKDDIQEYKGLWFSFFHHSSFSDTDPEKCLEKINSAIHEASDHLKKTSVIFLTFGTAMVYDHIKSGMTVSNCHKLPATEFSHRMLNPEEIISDCNVLFKNLKTFNPDVRIVFSISPVRYVKDGLEISNYSKSILNVAIHELIAQNDCCSYFPAYEIVMDDLRDYRFFDADMVHPSRQAVDYILEKFAACYFSEETIKINEQVKKLIKACNHRFLTNNKTEILGFLETQLAKAKFLYEKSMVNMQDEINYFEREIEFQAHK